ncbi:hypothetical protein APHAL10511_004957 [Amanita phalloides]|nr:hypothetical protein APHAL10511_004957 [Amanita phalloides]
MLVAQWVSAVDLPNAKNNNMWLVSYQALYLISLWAARLSLAVTIVRLCPQGTMRTICKTVAVLFGLASFTLILYKTIVCDLHDSGGVEFCAFDTLVGVVEISCDVIADSWLVGAPIHMLCRMRLPGRHLRMLVAIFMLNILTSFASIAHYTLLLLHENQASFIAANAQCATSLFVCNLLVLVTFLYRRIRGNAEETTVTEEPEDVTRSRRRPATRQSGPAVTRIEMTMVSMSGSRAAGPIRSAASRAFVREDSLPPPPCELSPSSTFPDLPSRQRAATEAQLQSYRGTASHKSLMPLPCNLSPTSTFPNLPAQEQREPVVYEPPESSMQTRK